MNIKMHRVFLIALLVISPLVQSCQTSKPAASTTQNKEMTQPESDTDQDVPKLKTDFSDLTGLWTLIKAVAGPNELIIPSNTLKPIRLNISQAIIDKDAIHPVNAIITGTGPVNGFGMEAKMMDDGTITTEVLTQTAMADINNKVNEFEKQYFLVLENAYHFGLEDHKLNITSTKGLLVFEQISDK